MKDSFTEEYSLDDLIAKYNNCVKRSAYNVAILIREEWKENGTWDKLEKKPNVWFPLCPYVAKKEEII